MNSEANLHSISCNSNFFVNGTSEELENLWSIRPINTGASLYELFPNPPYHTLESDSAVRTGQNFTDHDTMNTAHIGTPSNISLWSTARAVLWLNVTHKVPVPRLTFSQHKELDTFVWRAALMEGET